MARSSTRYAKRRSSSRAGAGITILSGRTPRSAIVRRLQKRACRQRDFLGDAANYAISLLVVGMALRFRVSAALLKGATMVMFGIWVVGVTV